MKRLERIEKFYENHSTENAIKRDLDFFLFFFVSSGNELGKSLKIALNNAKASFNYIYMYILKKIKPLSLLEQFYRLSILLKCVHTVCTLIPIPSH